MATYTDTEEFRGARFVGCDLSGVVMRGVAIDAADIDAPWIFEGDSYFKLNGVDVLPFVDAELNRRFPGRELRTAPDPDGLRGAWAALESSWSAVLDRVSAMPTGTVDRSVDGEWSFAQTLRHLVLATDMWLGKGIRELDQPFHPLGLSDASMADEGWDMSVFTTEEPAYDEILAARADRVAMVRDFIAGVTPEELAAQHPNPHDPAYEETTLSCLHTILGEEWDHQRYAVRDLDAIEAD
ncbi:MAG TPA: DinB family protein [Nocardioides sp.]|jgi:hypothetical protein|nr:DinB family protein [Nocardioides sp.]